MTTAKTDKRNTRRGGFYFVDGLPYRTVTTVLKVIDKPALMYWFGKEVYLGMVQDPTISEREAMALPFKVTKKAQQRGSTVHDIIEAWKNTGDVVGDDSQYGGYVRAFRSWLSDFNIEIVENERTVVSKKYGYAGTLDMLCHVGGSSNLSLVDIKTGKDLYPEVHMQMSAYKQALLETSVNVEKTYALLLREDGTYKFEQGQEALKPFICALEIDKFINKEMMVKIGYIK